MTSEFIAHSKSQVEFKGPTRSPLRLKKRIRYFLNQLVLFGSYFQFLISGKNSEKGFKALIDTFCFDGGTTSEFYVRVFRFFYRPYKIQQAQGLFGHLNGEKLHRIQSDLDRKGFATADVLVSEELCQKLESLTKSLKATPVRNSANESAMAPRVFDPANLVSSKYAYSCEDLAATPVVQEIMADESLLAVANQYFRAQPVLDSVLMGLSTDFSSVANTDAAQLFHFDMDRLRWLKYFVYLSDVDDLTGPHVFVEGTHGKGAIPPALLERGYSRILDEEVERHFPREKVKVFKYRRGTIFVEDTRGIHKGTVVKKGFRLLFQIQYNMGLFGDKNLKPHKVTEVKSPKLAQMIKKYPQVYSNFLFN